MLFLEQKRTNPSDWLVKIEFFFLRENFVLEEDGYGLGGYYGGYYPYYWGKRDTSEVATELKRDWWKKSEMVPVKRSVEETIPATRESKL